MSTALDPGAIEPESLRSSLRGSISWAAVSTVAALGVLIAVAAVTTPAFATDDNARAVVAAAALTGIAAAGLTFITLAGHFVSLSTTATAAAGGVALAMLMRSGWSAGLALVATLGLAVLAGAVQGIVVAKGANPIIVTLAAAGGLQGLTQVVSDGKEVRTGSTALSWLGDPRPLGLTMATYVLLLIVVVSTVYLRRHRMGLAVSLLGENRKSAVATGLPALAITITVFAIASLCASLVGVLSVASFNRATVDQFGGLTFDAIAAVLVGGTAIAGGNGSPLRTAAGAVFIATLMNFMLLRGWSYGTRLAVEGVVVVVAVTAYHVARQGRR